MKPFKFFIPGPLPGMNDMLNQSRVAYGTKARRRTKWHDTRDIWLQRIGLEIMAAVPTKRIDRAFFEFTWFEKDRRRDPDNISGAGHKLIFDAMVKCGLIENDGWKQVAGYSDTFTIEKDRPGVLVVVKPISKG
jgi:Holliday junction resolvase RusA-like endonuclease